MALTKLNNQSLTAVTSAGLPVSPVSAGSVLQTVAATYATETSITSTTGGSGTSTGLSVTITPTSTSNKLLINYCGYFRLATHAAPALSVEFHDGSSVVAADTQWGIYINGDGNEHNNRWRYPFMAYITPASTNAITYTVRAWKDGNDAWAQFQSGPSTISIQEIAG